MHSFIRIDISPQERMAKDFGLAEWGGMVIITGLYK
jgi:hypothetical protein